MKATRGPSKGGTASLQRISDWRSGRNVPAQFETLLPIPDGSRSDHVARQGWHDKVAGTFVLAYRGYR